MATKNYPNFDKPVSLVEVVKNDGFGNAVSAVGTTNGQQHSDV